MPRTKEAETTSAPSGKGARERIRAAEAAANAAAEAQHDKAFEGVEPGSLAVSPYAPQGLPPGWKPSHTNKMRPADAGFVTGTPAEWARRRNGYTPGTSVVSMEHIPAKAPDVKVTLLERPSGPPPEVEMVSAEGVPDLDALRRHNAEIAAAMELNAALSGEAPGPSTIASIEAGDKSLTVEGQLAEEDEDKGGSTWEPKALSEGGAKEG